ncbi:MAG: thioredoxin domain-containing protein [Desulfohalobiaceae bacterium]|nr:thioredoxin domain-containing protein [Desulfohalobiaceae bacterium]
MNRLANTHSPYLLQHAENPVDWHPWGDEALHLSREEDRPIFLSIGYATCHWCHVMAHESFEDREVADLLNAHFLPVKVDREERPDIDHVCMRACQLISGRGGWPQTLLLTPEGKPFFAATYIPKQGGFGQLGLLDLLAKVRDMWTGTQRSELEKSADSVTSHLRDIQDLKPAALPGEEALHSGFSRLGEQFDATNAGFGSAPKFPCPHQLLFLLRYHARTGNSEALNMAESTLRAMRHSGIFDHLGYGFHRYSTDPQWRLPHFEKMLYDQATHLHAYAEAFATTGKAEYAQTAREVASYVLRDLTSGEGGFFCGEDADSEGEEGKFYVWELAELERILSESDLALVRTVYGLTPEGNFQEEATGKRTGANVLHAVKEWADAAHELGQDTADLDTRVENIRGTLYTQREKRPRPSLDDKILTDWNGLMISALARTGSVLGEDHLVRAAEEAAAFLRSGPAADRSNLMHRYRDGDSDIEGVVDDYAFLGWGLLELYRSTGKEQYLRDAEQILGALNKRFQEPQLGGLSFTPLDREPFLTRFTESFDGALPSGGSVAAYANLLLAELTENPESRQAARANMESVAGRLQEIPTGHTFWLCALDRYLGDGTKS